MKNTEKEQLISDTEKILYKTNFMPHTERAKVMINSLLLKYEVKIKE